ncbi:hypothetical protein [Demequina iriomotensis]|uniref:hypothetical protein n=1 Tax=Demequina iriomotensis TaxID=1536641 RepID=UPI000785170E|nr:hypothetical protein [Demequina iriomotensis]
MPSTWGLAVEADVDAPREVFTVRDGELIDAGIRCTVGMTSLDCVEAASGAFAFSQIEVEWATDPVPDGALLDAGQAGWFVIVGGTAEPLTTVDGAALPLTEAIAAAEDPGYPGWEPALQQWGPFVAVAVLLTAAAGWLAVRRRRVP